MKRLAVLLVACCLVGKATAQPEAHESLLELKTLMESHFAETTIRDLVIEFELKRDMGNDDYVLTGRIPQLAGSSSVEALLRRINGLHIPADSTGYAGTVYFDRYTDSAVVDVRRISGNQIFRSVSSMPSPQGGVEAFSRRFHAFLSNQLKTGAVDVDTLMELSEFRFIAELDGSLTSLDTGIAKTLVTTFLRQEERWSFGVFSGRPLRNEVVLNVITEFVRTGQGWPDEYKWVHINKVPRFAIGKQLTYYAMNRASIPPGYVVVSAVYDPLYCAYRMPMIHGGTAEEAERLINDVAAVFNQGDPTSDYASYRRIYFYRDNR